MVAMAGGHLSLWCLEKAALETIERSPLFERSPIELEEQIAAAGDRPSRHLSPASWLPGSWPEERTPVGRASGGSIDGLFPKPLPICSAGYGGSPGPTTESPSGTTIDSCQEGETESDVGVGGGLADETVGSLHEAADAECWARLHEQLHSLHRNVQDFASKRAPPAPPAVEQPALRLQGDGVQPNQAKRSPLCSWAGQAGRPPHPQLTEPLASVHHGVPPHGLSPPPSAPTLAAPSPRPGGSEGSSVATAAPSPRPCASQAVAGQLDATTSIWSPQRALAGRAAASPSRLASPREQRNGSNTPRAPLNGYAAYSRTSSQTTPCRADAQRAAATLAGSPQTPRTPSLRRPGGGGQWASRSDPCSSDGPAAPDHPQHQGPPRSLSPSPTTAASRLPIAGQHHHPYHPPSKHGASADERKAKLEPTMARCSEPTACMPGPMTVRGSRAACSSSSPMSRPPPRGGNHPRAPVGVQTQMNSQSRAALLASSGTAAGVGGGGSRGSSPHWLPTQRAVPVAVSQRPDGFASPRRALVGGALEDPHGPASCRASAPTLRGRPVAGPPQAMASVQRQLSAPLGLGVPGLQSGAMPQVMMSPRRI